MLFTAQDRRDAMERALARLPHMTDAQLDEEFQAADDEAYAQAIIAETAKRETLELRMIADQ